MAAPKPSLMPDFWFTEKYTPHTGLTLQVRERLYDAKSDFQQIEVLDTLDYGRLLLLDGCVMLTDRDEHVYHEMISHVPLFSHPKPERVLIVGGGDGGAVREVLKHSSVKEVHLAEIDGEVIEVSRKYFPAVAAGLDDPRVEIFVRDGFDHLDEHQQYYDVILTDSIDPVGEAVKLFSESFYNKAKQSLRPGGVFVCQSESPFISLDVLAKVHGTLGKLYTHTQPYLVYIPTYPTGMWSFSMASDTVKPKEVEPDFSPPFLQELKYFTPDIFRSAFALPKQIHDALLKERMK